MPNYKGKHTAHIIGKIYDQMLRTVRETEDKKEKNIILYVGKLYGHMITAIQSYKKKAGKKYRLALIYDAKCKLDPITQNSLDKIDIKISCDSFSPSSIQKALLPYQDELLVVTCRAEDKIPMLSRIIPHTPYIKTPTAESLNWASDKILMRQRFSVHNKDITPAFAIVKDNSKSSIKKIEEEVGFPLMVKPAGSAASRLVNICFHKEELEDVLKKVFKKIESIPSDSNGKSEALVLVEQFIEGQMYSIDAYVNENGKVYMCPMVEVKTGKSIGFDDFFGYQQITPTLLNKESIATAEFIAGEAIHALALRNTTAHVELMKTEQGWKIIEMGARIGGFRHMMYEFSYDINHTANDVIIRLPNAEKPSIPKKIKGYTVAMKFFAKNEGKLTKLTGIKKIKDLKSFKRLYQHKNIGDQCDYAKHGGSSVFDLIMFNKDKAHLLADIRRVEQTIIIET